MVASPRRVTVALVEGELGERIDELRRTWDPRVASLIGPHISLIYEHVPVEALRAAARAVGPLQLGLTRVRRWEPEAGIYIDVVDPRGDLRRFRSSVLADPDPGYRPHVTLLHKDSIATPAFAADAWRALGGHSFDAPLSVRDAIVYDEESADVWREAGRFPFGS